MNWKDKLLSSGVPLEYEIGKILAEKDFCVDFDYSYTRLDDAYEKEFSVDIRASRYNPFEITDSRDTILDLDLMIECKYRNPSISWLFIPEINSGGFEKFSERGVIKIFDEFSEINSRFKSLGSLFSDTCLKGIEVNQKTGDTHDTGIRHGINQLLYSLPYLMYEHINSSFHDHINDVHPFVICPILVTTAELRILTDDFSIKKLQTSENLDEISKVVPYLTFHTDTTPSFDVHCSNIFEEVPLKNQAERFDHFKELRYQKIDFDNYPRIEDKYSSPSDLLRKLQNGILNGIFSQTIVCNFDSFSDLLDEIKAELKMLIEGFEKIKK